MPQAAPAHDATGPTQPAPEAPDAPFSLRASLREFATADPRSLGLFRVVFGVFLLLDLYRRVPDLVFFYTNEGMLPNHGAIYRPMSGHLFSVYHAFSTRGEVTAAFAATAVVYALYTVGFKTRVMQGLVLLLVTSLHSRNILLENGGDVVANLLALWTFFLPLGRRFSLDAMLASMRARRERGAADLDDRDALAPDRRPFVSLAMAAIVVNLAVIYYFNTVHKDGPTWRSATSVHYVFWADRLIQPLGVAVRQFVPPLAIKVMTVGTLVIESSICILLLSPFWIRSCRRVAALMVIALHCGFQTVGHFGLFSFVMMLHSILLLGPEDWQALARRMRVRLPSRRLIYDASCGFCHQVARVVRRLDHLGKITFVASDDPGVLPRGITPDDLQSTIVVSDATGARAYKRAEAVAHLLRALPYGVFAARTLELPGIKALATAGYDALAARRHDVSQALGFAACGLPLRAGSDDTPGASRATTDGVDRPLFGSLVPAAREAVVAMCIVALGSQVLVENRKVPKALKPSAQPALLAAIAQYPRFFQGWSMFAPVPPQDDGKLVVDAVTADGRHLDPLAAGQPVDFELPPVGEGMLMTQFWYEFHDRIRREANTRYRQHFHDWLAGWHSIERRAPADRVVSYDVYWVWRPTQPPFAHRREGVRKERIMDWHPSEAAPGAPTTPSTPTVPSLLRNLARPQP